MDEERPKQTHLTGENTLPGFHYLTMNITQTIRSAAVNGVISLEKALKIAAKIDEERNGTQELLQECEKHVGMLLGEKINVHVAAMNGTTFNLVEYHYEKPVGEQ